MITAWRIVSREHADDAFSGEGASRFPGRWNSRGSRVVYAAQSAALAALEMLVHLDRESNLRPYVLFACTFPAALVERIDLSSLPSNWKNDPPPPELRQRGLDWLRSGRSAVLQVPSVIVETESNYLMSSEHPDFARIEIATPVPFRLDLRLMRR